MGSIEKINFRIIRQKLTDIESGELTRAEVLGALESIQTVVNDLMRKTDRPNSYPDAFNIKKSDGPDA